MECTRLLLACGALLPRSIIVISIPRKKILQFDWLSAAYYETIVGL